MAKPTTPNPAAVALGRIRTARKAAASARNARKATKARMRLSASERSEQARHAARARWQATPLPPGEVENRRRAR